MRARISASVRPLTAVGMIAFLFCGCGAEPTRAPRIENHGRNSSFHSTSARPRAAHSRPAPQALVTAETENRLLVVDLTSGRIVKRVPVPPDPEDLAVVDARPCEQDGVVVVVSSRAGKVTVLDRRTLHPIKTFTGFSEPHIAALSPDDQHAYITDDTRGTLTTIDLTDMTVTSTVFVGAGAHHLSFSPNERWLWIALGESATRVAILDVTNPDHPRLVGHFSPGFPAHDLSFSPGGRKVWITSASGSDVTAFATGDHQTSFRVPVGPAPQHLVFQGRYGYLTSGYGRTIEKVDAATGRVLARTAAPFGSFELSAADGYVVTSSLLRGTLAIYNRDLKLQHVVHLAPATREVAISRP